MEENHQKLQQPFLLDISRYIKPIEISINVEYFRPKFEEIFHKYITKYVHEGVYLSSSGEIIYELIECLKNPEGK